MDSAFQFFAGIDWGSDKHRVCLTGRNGQIMAERWIEHSGDSLAELAAWLRQHTSDSPSLLAAAIEIPRGAIVETLAGGLDPSMDFFRMCVSGMPAVPAFTDKILVSQGGPQNP